MSSENAPDGALKILSAVQEYAMASADDARPDLYQPLTFLLAQVRQSLHMDVVFVSRFIDTQRVFEVVSAEGEAAREIAPGKSDPLLDSYCHRVLDGRLPAIIPDSEASPEAAGLAITRKLNIRAYLSAPVVLPNGEVFGTVCCISHRVRPDLREADARALAAVADAVAASVERRGRIRFASWTGHGR